MMKLRITNVDMYGHWGREFHPSPSDVGKLVYPVKLDTRYIPDSAFSEPVVDDRGTIWLDALPALKADESADEKALLEVLWTVITEENQVLQLMGFEVEPVIDETIVSKLCKRVDETVGHADRVPTLAGIHLLAKELGVPTKPWPGYDR